MAQLVASVSGLVLGGVAEVSLEAKYLQHLSAQLIHYIPPYIYTYIVDLVHCGHTITAIWVLSLIPVL